MKSPENMIVTVEVGSGRYDMELPAFMPLRELSPKIVQTLRSMEPDRYAQLSQLLLSCHGRSLPQDKTLASCGVWDGSILEGRMI